QNTFTFHTPDVQGGNKILVNKFLYKFEPPERWNVIVFKYPDDPLRKNFIKRLVGLPGETLTIDNRGDLSVQTPSGEKFLARKPRAVQEEIWSRMPVYDSSYPDPRVCDDPKNRSWRPDTEGRWTFQHTPNGPETFAAKPGDGETMLGYHKEIFDSYGYNTASHAAAGRNRVGDIRVRVKVVPDANCKAIRLATVENERVFTAEVPVGTGDVAILSSQAGAPPKEVFRAPCAPLKAGAPSDLALGYADERLTLVV